MKNEKSIGFGDGGTDVYGADCMWQKDFDAAGYTKSIIRCKLSCTEI